jgi:hypothetical protein
MMLMAECLRMLVAAIKVTATQGLGNYCHMLPESREDNIHRHSFQELFKKRSLKHKILYMNALIDSFTLFCSHACVASIHVPCSPLIAQRKRTLSSDLQVSKATAQL